MQFLKNLFSKEPSSGSLAKDRLKLVLIHDRANCNTDLLEMMKNDIMQVIAKYMDIDEAVGMDINIEQTTDDNNNTVPVLYANIPIKNMRKKKKPKK
ncbi:MAG: cell division topological specificity factor MinE [Defluviitaleaceae bacterium]|nr:cell division topological specificity factor MinE [Defluviitaleaceae bacterium]